MRNELAATRKAVSKAIDFVVNGDYVKAVKNVHQAAVRETVKAMEGDVTATANVTQGVLALALARTGSKSKGRLTVENPAGPSSVVQRDMFNMQGIKDRLSQGKGLLEKFRQRVKQGDVSENMATKSGPVAKNGTSVLGKYPDCIKLSNELGAKRFSIPTDVWNRMSKVEQWGANKKFLDRMIKRGDDIVLSNPVKNVKDISGAFRKELDYLMGRGFKLSDDGARLIK